MSINNGIMSDFNNPVDGLLANYENGLINEHDVVTRLYKYWPDCEEQMQDFPELVELMDKYVDMLVTRA